ncbi:MAG: ATP-binding cassette domain-containing protein [Deltaproteobacteria bacterium]
MTERTVALELSGIEVELGGRAILAGVDLTVFEGELVALVGSSGGGKTTLLRCVNRLAVPSRGTVRVFGRDVREVSPPALRRTIGYAVQQGALFPHWDAERNAGAVLELLGWAPERRRERVHELLLRVGLDPAQVARLKPRELSGGQTQRVAIARALAAEPKLLLLDEPFGALDPITRRRVRQPLAKALRESGAATLLVTHDMAEAFELADRVAVLERGRLSQLGAPAELREAPKTPFVRELCQGLS